MEASTLGVRRCALGRSSATLRGYHAGRSPRNKGMRYPADPPTVDEIVGVMRHTPDDRHGWRVRAMIVVLWRAGLRIQERSRSQNTTSTTGADRSWVRNGKGAADARSEWTSNGSGTSTLRTRPPRPSCGGPASMARLSPPFDSRAARETRADRAPHDARWVAADAVPREASSSMRRLSDSAGRD
jgi:hypothetical protein